MPVLLANCRAILAEEPLFVVLTAYAIRASALSIHYAMQGMLEWLCWRAHQRRVGSARAQRRPVAIDGDFLKVAGRKLSMN